MRQIILDTETTGLSPRNGNRILEIGCVEVLNRQLSGKNLHLYINPERDSEEGALAVHGLTTEFLADKPTFKQIAAEFLDYVRGAQIIIHNAPFDVGFLDAELALLGLPPFKEHVSDVVDSLQMAKELHPGRRNSLDALCDRYGISNAHRVLHGALLDAELLAEVYLSMTRGQNSLTMDLGAEEDLSEGEDGKLELAPLAEVIVVTASEEELGLHEEVLNQLDKEARGSCVWRFEPPTAEAGEQAA
ncbi:DNA polymerase III subunit epsilon [Herbaspirillum rubrisubalbicans]|uniref:DNA polymerase III subunit epsilon n=2 Tax=Herbaspirillum rubrisubalbicans TaxID=80842 RepID=A0ABX9C2V2_9BURK|nr:DNA polymerase III subunit epsilon [Herbaspirillum rubrisubalbicans]MCP1573855.1 DNA polymerase-3 subunit epsilon [Herbaspirillum rubrisubalbicans]NQE48142.1 DNA polymerase III subunit epsilon [Herbaspirillum rubrisubalbicans]QJQ02348.1 DNA polymerase III subunit epsilon [Herbaspirillum rubrisubalbicans Os34]RAM64667.1 DNA polymerase III subunit epsilon [Herbaspirillum rubrisubalbicans]RAN49885.1 DNA polymerase III subunit epsilon [Herbaspirillum rubrisubalbicans]